MATPKVSIGLPVYNGGNFLAEALDSILSQTYTDFELIISDNASTDETGQIARKYANKDQRVRYYHNEQNLGASWNFNRVFQLSSGKYFKWAAHDDLIAPDFLMRCVDVLDQNTDVVLAHSKAKIIDEHGECIQDYGVKLRTWSEKAHVRFHDLLNKNLGFEIFGLIRTGALKMTPLFGNYAYTEKVLLLRLGLIGRFQELPEYLFLGRKHPHQSMSRFVPDHMIFTQMNPQYTTKMLPDFHRWTVWFDTTKEGKILFPHWRIMQGMSKAIRQTPKQFLSLSEKIRCYLSLVKKSRKEYILLVEDLVAANRMRIKGLRK